MRKPPSISIWMRPGTGALDSRDRRTSEWRRSSVADRVAHRLFVDCGMQVPEHYNLGYSIAYASLRLPLARNLGEQSDGGAVPLQERFVGVFVPLRAAV